jgi:uncharacterized protein (TIGR00369 family)
MTDTALPQLLPLQTAPFTDWMQVHEVTGDGRKVCLKLRQRKELSNRHGVLHGGALATLLDSAMARAARAIPSIGEIAGTVDIQIQFLQPASGLLTATGRVEHASKSLAFCRGEVLNEAGEAVALASATMKLRRAASSDAKQIALRAE